MSTKRLASIALIVLALLAAGCASGGGGGGAAAPQAPPPEEVIAQMVTQAMELLTTGDVENLMALYADDFASDQGDKAGMTQFLTMARDQGMLEGFTANTEAMVVTVEGDTATVSGVTVEGAFGVLNLGFGLENRDGAWLITSQSQQ
jgi:hypothetical protein